MIYREDNNDNLKGFKGNLSKGGLRVPCIASWPGTIPPGGTQVSHTYLYFGYGKRTCIVHGAGETRSDAEIVAEAKTKVVVPKFPA